MKDRLSLAAGFDRAGRHLIVAKDRGVAGKIPDQRGRTVHETSFRKVEIDRAQRCRKYPATRCAITTTVAGLSSRWRGPSLELIDRHADNSKGEAWASERRVGAQSLADLYLSRNCGGRLGPTTTRNFILACWKRVRRCSMNITVVESRTAQPRIDPEH